MTKIKVNEQIAISPKYLDGKLNKHILTKVRELYINKCTKKYGYFLDIIKLNKIKDNYISTITCNTIFDIEFTANILNPKIADKYTGVVCLILPTGILVEIESRMNVFITGNDIDKHGYIYNDIENLYEKSNKKIVKGDKIKVEIINIKYEGGKFICIGNLF